MSTANTTQADDFESRRCKTPQPED